MKFCDPILVVGFGSIGRRHTNNLLSITNSPITILSKRKNITKNDFINYNKNKKRIKIYSKIDKCLEEKPSVAFITNETSLHVNYALKLAKKKIDLFIEKPLSHSLKNISSLNSIIKKNKQIVMIGCNFRFYPTIRKMKELVDKKLIGKIISVQSENSSYLPDWHPNEDYSKGYVSSKNLGGGVTLTQIHELDYLIWMFGYPKKMKAIVGKFSNLKVETDDLSVSLLELQNKIIVELHLDYFSGPLYKRLKIRGSKGILSWDSNNNEIRIYHHTKKKYSKIKIKNNYKLTENVNKMYIDEIKYFISCLTNRKQPMNNLTESAKTLRVALDLKKSSGTKFC